WPRAGAGVVSAVSPRSSRADSRRVADGFRPGGLARGRHAQHVADRGDTRDRAPCAAVEPELLSQMTDVRTERIGRAVLRAPDIREQAIRGHDVFGVVGERVEEPEFG